MKKVFNLTKSKDFWLLIVLTNAFVVCGIIISIPIMMSIGISETDPIYPVCVGLLGSLIVVSTFFSIAFHQTHKFRKIVFEEDNVVRATRGMNIKQSPILNVKCAKIIEFELSLSILKLPKGLTFKTQDTQYDVNINLFSRKQILEILNEIQNRGGLQGKTLDKTIFKAKKLEF